MRLLARPVVLFFLALLFQGSLLAAPPAIGPVGPAPIERPVKPALPGMPIQSNMIESRLGFMIRSPLLFFNNTGVLEYSAGSGALSVMADPLALRLNMSDPPLLIFPAAGSKSLTVDIVVAPDGSLVGGVPGDDMTITGEVTIGPDTFSGVLLRGEVTEYMGEDGGGTTDFHSFRFDLSGGLLAGLYGPDVAIELTSEMSDFTGDYTVDFSGEAKGNVGVVECTGTIGDFVWLDLDGNGIQDDGEPGIGGVQLILTDADGNVSTATTQSNGFYQFSDLCAGSYMVEVNPASLPPGLAPTLINAPGSDDSNDSNDPAGTTVTLPDNSSSDQDTDFGYVELNGALGDFVWEDLNMDGVQDGNEPGVAGVMVNLYNCEGEFIASATTNASGFYLFDNLPAGCYQVEFIRPGGFAFSPMDQTGDGLDSDPDPTTGLTDPVFLGAGETNLDVDAGIFRPPSAELGDRFWEDVNGNGIQDPGEPGIPGVTVNLYDCGGTLLDSTATGANGMYLFTELAAGCYVVGFEPTGCVITAQDVGIDDTVDSDADPINGLTGPIDLQEMESDLTWDGGCYFPAGLGDFLWNDLNQDGIQDPNEPGIEGQTVILLDALMMPTGLSTVTGPNGGYQFTGLPPGSYFVQFTAPPGFVYTAQDVEPDDSLDSDANNAGKTDKVTLESGEFDPTIDAGVFVPNQPAISIEKSTNGDDADNPTGPFIPNGDPVLWEYLVTNTGNVTLSGIFVTDDQGVLVSCPTDTLAPGDSMTCTGDGAATVDQYENIGETCGVDPQGLEVCDDDPSHYFGADPSIDIEKATNGEDADVPTGPYVTPGASVTWTYVVTNTGNVTLSDVMVSDDQGVTVTCPLDTLVPGQIMECMADGTAVSGQYANLGSVTGTPPDGAGDPVMDEDPSHYFGAEPGIDIEKATNGEDADNPTGPLVPVGGTVEWTYVVTNTGNVELSNIAVTDSQGVAVSCPATTLAPGASFTCTASGIAIVGQYDNVGSVTGNPPVGPPVNDDDPSHYFGAVPEIGLEKLTNGEDADNPTGPILAVGSTVTWTYVINNKGNVTLDSVALNDSVLGAISCNEGPIPALTPGDIFLCTVMGEATAGQYMNLGEVCALDPMGTQVCDDDPSHYLGANPSIDIEKATNGFDADDPTGPFIAAGGAVSWTYVVTNTGNVTLSGITVTDDQGVPVVCPADTLTAGASFVCAASGVAQAGQYRNLGSVTGTPPVGPPVRDEDPSHYFGVTPGIDIEKSTNGIDADDPNAGDAPQLLPGDVVNWSYVVRNTGNVVLTGITVADDQGVAVSCPSDNLAPGTSFTCTASGLAADLSLAANTVTGTCGTRPNTPLYENIGTATGVSPTGPVADSDPSHYCNVEVTEQCVVAAASDPDWAIFGGDHAFWLPGIDTDNEFLPVAGTFVENSGTGTAVLSGRIANRSNPNNGFDVVVNLTGRTDVPPPGSPKKDLQDIAYSENGGPVDTDTWYYYADYTGTLVGFGAYAGSSIQITPVVAAFQVGIGANQKNINFGASSWFDWTVTAQPNQGSFPQTGRGDINVDLNDECDPGNPAIRIEKSTNGVDADDPNAGDAPQLAPGDAVVWAYEVTNTGNVSLTDIVVADDQGVAVSCPAGQLAPGATFTCTASGLAEDLGNTSATTVPGLCGSVPNSLLYENRGTVSGSTAGGQQVMDSDLSHYCNGEGLCVVAALPDPVWSTSGSDHAFILPGIDSHTEFLPDAGSFSENLATGTAILAGRLANRSNPANGFDVVVNLSGGTDIAPPGSPKKELRDNAYSENGGPVDTSTWRYYTDYSGTLVGFGGYAGSVIQITPTGPSFQIGVGANNKNINFGASSWFDWTVTSQPNSGQFPYTGEGDINVDLNDECIPGVCQPGDFADHFGGDRFTNNDGSLDWTGPWIEDDAAGSGPGAGNAKVWGGYLLLDDYPDTGTEPSLAREANLSQFASATLTFDFRTTSGVDHDDAVTLEISNDGGLTYQSLEVFTNISGASDSSRSYDISAYISSRTRIRFRVSAYYGGESETFKVDNLRIEGDCEPPPPQCTPGDFADHFGGDRFTNNDGSLDWSGPWIEYDVEGSGPGAGNAKVWGGYLKLDDNPDTGTDPSLAREADLSQFSSATLSFDFWTTSDVDESDAVTLEISSDGGATYQTLEVFTDIDGSDNGWRSYDISAYISSETRVRFRVSAYYGGDDETIKVDNLRIEGDCD